LRAAAKVAACKTRVFEQPPLEYVILVRKYFGSFLNYFKKRAGFVFYHGIGRDKDEVWAAYWKGLRQVSDVGMDYDFANYDGTVHQAAFQFFEDVVDVFYADATIEERRARSGLVHMLRETYHLIGDLVAYSIKGNKSGNPFTDVFNTITNTYLLYFCWMTTMTGSERPDLHSFDEYNRALIYGDDIIISTHPSCLEKFNGETVQAVLKCLGYEVTSAAKSETIEKFRDLEELTFLKSPFVNRDGVCWAPLPKKDVFKELKYRPKQFATDDEDLRTRMLVVQQFLCHHGREELESFQGEMRRRHGLPGSWFDVSYDDERRRLKVLQQDAVLYE